MNQFEKEIQAAQKAEDRMLIGFGVVLLLMLGAMTFCTIMMMLTAHGCI